MVSSCLKGAHGRWSVAARLRKCVVFGHLEEHSCRQSMAKLVVILEKTGAIEEV